MSHACDEAFSAACADCVTHELPIFIREFIVPRREEIVRYGRKAQALLHIPPSLHVFSDLDPGMLDDDIEMGAHSLCCAGAYFGFGLVLLVLFFFTNTYESMPTGLSVMMVAICLVVVPVITVTVMCVRLVRSRRLLTRAQRFYARYYGTVENGPRRTDCELGYAEKYSSASESLKWPH